MERAKKQLKIASYLVLLFVGISLLEIFTELMFGDINTAQIPEGAPENILLITKTFLLVFSLVLMLPKIYVGVKGLKIAKHPNASKRHITWAVIIFVFTLLGLIEPAMAILNQEGVGENVSLILGILVELTIYYDYIKYAKLVAKMSE